MMSHAVDPLGEGVASIKGDDNTVFGIFQELFRVSPERLSDETRRGDLEEWDSLGHIMLVDALNRRFNITISPERALEMETIRDIKRVISESIE